MFFNATFEVMTLHMYKLNEKEYFVNVSLAMTTFVTTSSQKRNAILGQITSCDQAYTKSLMQRV
jgi:hypothetical protein